MIDPNEEKSQQFKEYFESELWPTIDNFLDEEIYPVADSIQLDRNKVLMILSKVAMERSLADGSKAKGLPLEDAVDRSIRREEAVKFASALAKAALAENLDGSPEEYECCLSRLLVVLSRGLQISLTQRLDKKDVEGQMSNIISKMGKD